MKRLAKAAFNSILGSASSSVIRRINFLLRKFQGGYHSINQLDKQLEKYVDYDNGFYVELGANDGVTQSNSIYFETKRNWSGVLVEPSPHNFLRCREQRSKKNHIFCNACVSFDYHNKYVDMTFANLMTISGNLSLDLESTEEHLNAAKQFLTDKEVIFKFGAVATTLNSLLEEAYAPKVIDFLSLDVEGAELEVLKGINFDKFLFKFMLIEVRNLTSISNFLGQRGYSLEKQLSEHDYLFKCDKCLSEN
jgi:FkbM family methyltransferase